MIFASVEISWDLQTPLVLGGVILATTVVIAAIFGHHPVSSTSANHPRNRLMQDSLDAPKGHFRIQTTPRSNRLQEKRAALRREGNPVWVLVADRETADDQFFGAVLDRSTGGLRLSLPHEAFAGRFLIVRAVNAPPAFPWITVEVRHCRQRKDRWIAGCKFERKFLWSELHTFG